MLTTEDTEDTERATPETDGQLVCAVGRKEIQAGLVPADFARKLERERDELRAYLDAAHYATCNLELREKLDEAMELLRKALEAAK